MGEILLRPGQWETFHPVRVARVQLSCSLYEIVHAPGLSVCVTSVVEQNPMAKVNAMFCYCPLFWFVQLDMLWCSLILVLLEQMVNPIYVFPHLQGGNIYLMTAGLGHWMEWSTLENSLGKSCCGLIFDWDGLIAYGFVWTCICCFGRLYRECFSCFSLEAADDYGYVC